MALTLADLLSPKTRTQLYTDLLGYLAGFGWVRNWASGARGRTLFELVAWGLEELHQVTSDVTMGGLLDYAAALDDPDWLDLLGEGFYRLARNPATVARLGVTLTAAPAAGPYTFAAGDLTIVRNDAGALRYRSATSGTLVAGGTLDVDVDAESPGTAYNLSGLVTPLTLLNPPAGVTVALRDVGGGSPMVAQAVDTEENGPYAERCRLRWATLAYDDPRDKFAAWAREADPSITSVGVDDANPLGPGTVAVYLASATGAASPAAVTAANALIQARRGLPSLVTVQAATEVPVAIAATAYAEGVTAGAVGDALRARLVAYQARLAVGRPVIRAQVIEELMNPLGVTDVALATPAGNTTTTIAQIGKLAYAIAPDASPTITVVVS